MHQAKETASPAPLRSSCSSSVLLFRLGHFFRCIRIPADPLALSPYRKCFMSPVYRCTPTQEESRGGRGSRDFHLYGWQRNDGLEGPPSSLSHASFSLLSVVCHRCRYERRREEFVLRDMPHGCLSLSVQSAPLVGAAAVPGGVAYPLLYI